MEEYKCDKCGKTQKAVKRMLIARTPKVLVVHLKRFKVFPRKKKINDCIEFPLKCLDIGGYD